MHGPNLWRFKAPHQNYGSWWRRDIDSSGSRAWAFDIGRSGIGTQSREGSFIACNSDEESESDWQLRFGHNPASSLSLELWMSSSERR